MPQGPAHLHEIFGDDGTAWLFLEERRFTQDRFVISPPKGYFAELSPLERAAIDYLCMEWDWDYQPNSPKLPESGSIGNCDSCHGLNISCPKGCERDPLTGELVPIAETVAFQEWLRDLKHEDPVGFETRCGEGWTTDHYVQKYAEDGWPEYNA